MTVQKINQYLGKSGAYKIDHQVPNLETSKNGTILKNKLKKFAV